MGFMKRSRIIWMVSTGAVVVLIAYAVFVRNDGEAPSPDASSSPEANDEAPLSATSGAVLMRRSADARSPASAASIPEGQAETPATPECRRDEDCRGPHTAECVAAQCQGGTCVYDREPCECRTSADCDDGDPCTRNHCFVPTMSCIYIPEGCDSHN